MSHLEQFPYNHIVLKTKAIVVCIQLLMLKSAALEIEYELLNSRQMHYTYN